MGLTCGQGSLKRILTYFAVLSGILSACGVALWAKSCYDVLILSDVRQNIRLFILQKVDEELEEMLDQYVPGPRGHRGNLGIVEPPDLVIQFENPYIFLGIGFGTILGHAIQFLLAIWLFIVLRTGSLPGVRVWFIGTLMIAIGTLIGLVIQLTLVTFHGFSVATTSFLLIFYTIGLIFAFKFKGGEIPDDLAHARVGKSTEMTSMIKSSETQSVEKEKEYRPIKSPAGKLCAELGALFL